LASPYHGGTHLPDMTVVTPVLLAGRAAPDTRLASCAHQADIQGATSGSTPPASKTIEEEGVLLTHLQLVAAGVLQELQLHRALTQARHPARRTKQNLPYLRNARGSPEPAPAAAITVLHPCMTT
jgi:5-oxoprolinase (ATP-hydrolysing)